MAEKWAMAMSIAVTVAAVAASMSAHLEPIIIEDEPGFPEPVFVEGRSVTILTDKQVYNLGEIVRYAIVNTGTEDTQYRNTAYESHIEDISGNHITSLGFPGMSITTLKPGERAQNIWFQDDYDNKLVPEGKYVIITGFDKSEPFTIIHDESAFPQLIFDEGPRLRVITDKYEYQIGEVVRYAIVNTGTEDVDVYAKHYKIGSRVESINVYIKNDLGEIVYRINCNSGCNSKVYSFEPREMIYDSWYQVEEKINGTRQQAPPGTYSIVAFGWESGSFIIRE